MHRTGDVHRWDRGSEPKTSPRCRYSDAGEPGGGAEAIVRTAKLFRNFGEDYHEKKLEEAHIFPRFRQAGGPVAQYIDVLLAEHRRGREVTDYILAATRQGTIGNQAKPLARAFVAMDRMYENHAAREDTIVFPAGR